MSCLAKQPVLTAVTELPGCPLCRGIVLKTISEHNGKRLLKCVQCSASFVLPQPTAGALTAHFEDSPKLSERDLEIKFERNRERVLARVADYIQSYKRGGSILDVGCATGFFLARFFSSANWQAWGVELSPQTAEKAIRKGLRVRQANIHSAKFAESFFDVVSVVDTFYYFLEPQFELAECHRILKPGGLLVLELPLGDSRIWRASHQVGKLLSGRRQELLESSDHLFYYNPKSIKLLLERCGFRVQAILPLPGNTQEHFCRNLIYRAYSLVSLALHSVSGSRMFGPRFLVAAGKIAE